MSPQGFTWVCHPVVASVVDTQPPVVASLERNTRLLRFFDFSTFR